MKFRIVNIGKRDCGIVWDKPVMLIDYKRLHPLHGVCIEGFISKKHLYSCVDNLRTFSDPIPGLDISTRAVYKYMKVTGYL